MPKVIKLELAPEERSELQQIRDKDRRPYMRERAAAILRIADGTAAHSVAKNGIIKPRKPDTVYSWLHTYQENGKDGLVQKPRRSRSFSP